MKDILAIVAATILAIAAGGFHGMAIVDVAAKAGGESKADAAHAPVKVDALTRDLKPIVTNLAGPAGAWVRLEATLVVEPKAALDDKAASDIANDVVAFLRTLTAAQLEGVAGLRRLRDDLNERLALRSAGRVREILIQTLVVQ